MPSPSLSVPDRALGRFLCPRQISRRQSSPAAGSAVPPGTARARSARRTVRAARPSGRSPSAGARSRSAQTNRPSRSAGPVDPPANRSGRTPGAAGGWPAGRRSRCPPPRTPPTGARTPAHAPGAHRRRLLGRRLPGGPRPRHQVQMAADHPAGVGPAQLAGDRRAPVAALRPEPLVAQPRHRLGPGVRDPGRLPARPGDRPGRPEPRDARDDDTEGAGRVPAVRRRSRGRVAGCRGGRDGCRRPRSRASWTGCRCGGCAAIRIVFGPTDEFPGVPRSTLVTAFHAPGGTS